MALGPLIPPLRPPTDPFLGDREEDQKIDDLAEVPFPQKCGESPAVAPGSPDTRWVAFTGDWQIHKYPYIAGVSHSLMANIFAPSQRLPGTNLGLPHSVVEMLRQGISPSMRPAFEGIIGTGDMPDLGNVEEYDVFEGILGRLKQIDEKFRLLQLWVSNHDLEAHGYGDILWGMAIILNLEKKNDFEIPQLGGPENILDKKILIERMSRTLFGRKPEPVVLGPVTYWKYQLRDLKEYPWDDTREVFQRFWKKMEGVSQERWRAVIDYRSTLRELVTKDENEIDKDPEERWIHVSAVKLASHQTSVGPVPVYVLGLDTLDKTMAHGPTTWLGLLYGQVSPIQVKILDAFITETKKRKPNALFIVGGHYPVNLIGNVEGSGFARILSDPSVIAYLGAHTHRREFEDLNGKFGIKRTTPLPEIVVPAVIDYPNEMVVLKHGLKQGDSDRLIFEFKFTGIDRSAICGKSDAVQREIEALKPHLVSYREALRHFKDPRMKEIATPGTELSRIVYLLANVDHGLLAGPDRLNDEVVARDVIPSQVASAQLFMRLFLSLVKLNLMEIGLQREAEKLEAVYLKKLEKIHDHYEAIEREWKLVIEKNIPRIEFEFDKKSPADIRKIDQLSVDLARETFALVDHLRELLATERLSADKRKLVQGTISLARDANLFSEHFKSWLLRYEKNLRTRRPPDEMVAEADIFFIPNFRNALNTSWNLPAGTYASAFMTELMLESSKRKVLFYEKPGALKQTVPSTIAIEVSPMNGKTTVRPPAPKESEDIIQKKLSLRVEPSSEFAKQMGSPEWHPSFKLGYVWGNNQSRTNIALGAQMHLLNHDDYFRVNLGLNFGAELVDGDQRLIQLLQKQTSEQMFTAEFPFKFYASIGDPYGLVEGGLLSLGGFVLRQKPDVVGESLESLKGLGGYFAIYEGSVAFEFSHRWYGDHSDGWRIGLNTDLLRALKYLNWIK